MTSMAGQRMISSMGGAGNDGLFAGMGWDQVWGQSGADRFLVREYRNDSSGFTYDQVRDKIAEDVSIVFRDSSNRWTDHEILHIDPALAELHHATNNTRLLKRADQNSNTTYFEKLNTWNTPAGGVAENGGGYIRFGKWAFHGLSNGQKYYIMYKLRHLVLHELAHNWETESGSLWNAFLNVSGWTNTQPQNPSLYTQTSQYGQTWWYLTNRSNGFISGYASNHPLEDFAETFAAYFLRSMNETDNDNLYDHRLWNPTPILQQKLAIIDQLVKQLTS